MKRIGKADEDYWKRYRATPKAYIRLDDGQKLWATRFGKLSSIRIDIADEAETSRSSATRSRAVCCNCCRRPRAASSSATSAGRPSRRRAARPTSACCSSASACSSSSPRCCWSGLLVRLNLDRRATEIGVLAATGWTPGAIRRLLVCESAILVFLGAAVGLLGATGYAWLMLRLLAVQWPGGKTLQFLTLHAEPMSFAIGYVSAVVVGLVTVLWALRGYAKMSPRQLLAGRNVDFARLDRARRDQSRHRDRLSRVRGAVADRRLLLPGRRGAGGVVLHRRVPDARRAARDRLASPETLVPTTRSRRSCASAGRTRAGTRRAALLTVGLLAAATFLIVAMQAFQQRADGRVPDQERRQRRLLALRRDAGSRLPQPRRSEGARRTRRAGRHRGEDPRRRPLCASSRATMRAA